MYRRFSIVFIITCSSCGANTSANAIEDTSGGHDREARAAASSPEGTPFGPTGSVPPLAEPLVEGPHDIEAPESTRAILRRSAAVLEAVVETVSYTYDEQRGPRTLSRLRVEEVYTGNYAHAALELAAFGGPTPDGTFFSSSAAVDLVVGARYVLFLRNDAWFYSPLAAPALRVNEASSREVLSDSRDNALTEITPDGLSLARVPAIAEEVTGTPGHSRTLASGASGLLPAGTLDRLEFKRLLLEAVASEGLALRGRFSRDPSLLHHATGWRVVPTTPDI